jgi:hypothetical protein
MDLVSVRIRVRQKNGESGSPVHSTLKVQLTFMGFDDIVNNSQAKARTGCFGCEIRIKDVGLIIFADAFAAVRDPDFYTFFDTVL